MKNTFSGLSAFSLVFLAWSTTAFAANHTGMWWDPAKEGTGVYIEHLEEGNCICGAWYLYDENGLPFWTTFWGTLAGNSATVDLYSFTGPPLGGPWDVSSIHSFREGSATFDFNTDSSITMTFNVRNHAGRLDLVRFSLAICPGWLWWDPEKPGQGVVFFPMGEIGENEEIAIAWYVYDSTGKPVWYTALGPAREKNLPANQFSGPRLGEPWDNSKLKSRTVGTIGMENITGPQLTNQGLEMLESLTNIMSYSIQEVSGTLTIEPFWCESLCK